MKNCLTTILTLFVFFSCTKEKGENESAKSEQSAMSKKWKQTKEIFVESDSAIALKKDKYFSNLQSTYSEYKDVSKWFDSKPKQCLGESGEYYKMLKNEIDNNNTITHGDLSKISSIGTYKYLYDTKSAYYIFDLFSEKGNCIYRGVRRIKKGFGNQPVHDLVFDSLGELSKEVYQGEMKSDLYAKNGHLFFSFEKKSGDERVRNTIDLGVEKDF